MNSKPKIVELLATRTREPGKVGQWAHHGPLHLAPNPFAHYDFKLRLDTGEVYQIALITNDPPAIEWFQADFEKRPRRYQKIG